MSFQFNRGLEGIKPYVGGKQKREAQKVYHVEDAAKLSSNENPIGVAPAALRCAAESLPGANIYPESANIDLREKIAERFGLLPENVFVGNGADEVIYYAAMVMINDGDEVVIPKITFPIYEIAFRIMRAQIVHSSMRDLCIDLDDLIRRVTGRTKAICLCNPNNPTGHAIGRGEIDRFMERVPPEVIILMDEAYSEFADSDTFPDTLSKLKKGQKNLLITRTFSKIYGLAGLRVGYGMGNPDLIGLMHRIKLPFNISLVSQNAALGALDDTEFLMETLRITDEGKRQIYSALDALGLKYILSSTNFIFIDTARDGDLIAEELMKRGVIVRSAKNYGTPNHIRVTVGTKDQNQRFIEALRTLFGSKR
jgi:histidinol-phosphate aminotransferase